MVKLSSVAHHFHSPKYDDYPFKLQPGGAGYELTYGASAVLPYLYRLSQTSGELVSSEQLLPVKSKTELRQALERTSDLFSIHERSLVERLLGYLTSPALYKRGVRIVGPEGLEHRAPTISFIVIGSRDEKPLTSQEIVEQMDKKGTVSLLLFSLVEPCQ